MKGYFSGKQDSSPISIYLVPLPFQPIPVDKYLFLMGNIHLRYRGLPSFLNAQYTACRTDRCSVLFMPTTLSSESSFLIVFK